MVTKAIKKKDNNDLTCVFILVCATIASILGFFSLRPEVFYFCTIVLIMSLTALLTNNKVVNSFAIASLPIYIILTFIVFNFSLWGGFVIHFLNLALGITVLVKHWKNASPFVIALSAIFDIVYIQAFIISIDPTYGANDPFHQYMGVIPSIYVLAFGLLMAIIIFIKKKNGKWY